MKRYVVVFNGLEDEKLIEKVGGIIVDPIPFINNMLIADLPKEAVEILLKDERIKEIEEEHAVEPTSVDYNNYDYSYGYCEGYQCLALKLRDYWTRGITGAGIKVGVVDSGIYPNSNLPPLAGGHAGDPANPFNLDVDGHGTHIAGIIAGKHTGEGSFRGIAPDIQLYSIRVDLNDGTRKFSSSQILSGINYAIQQGIHVLNCSFETSSSDATFNEALRQAVDRGMIIVAAAGNYNEPSARYPARLDYVWGVINVKQDFTRNPSSNYGTGCDFATYGTSIVAANNADRGMTVKTGTSMAAPIITGLAALYKQLFPTLTPAQLKQKMIDNSTQSTWTDELAWGTPMPPAELYSREVTSTMPKQAYFSKNGNLVPARYYKNSGTQSSPNFVRIKPKIYKNNSWVAVE